MIGPRATVPGFIQCIPPQLFPVWIVHALAKPKTLPSLQQAQADTKKRTKLTCVLMKKCTNECTAQKSYKVNRHIQKKCFSLYHSFGAPA